MGAVGKKLRRTTDGYAHWCPACDTVHHYRVATDGRPCWQFNGNVEQPSFTPSMLIRWGNRVPGNEQWTDDGGKPSGGACHYFVTDGRIAYCGDSTHAMAGKTVDLPDWPYAQGAYGGIVE